VLYGPVVRLEDFLGRYTPVVFSPLRVPDPSPAYARFRRALRDGGEAFARDDRFRLLVVGPADGPQALRDYQAAYPLPGVWGYLESRPGARSRVLADYGADRLPQGLLVGPDGTVVARYTVPMSFDRMFAHALEQAR
jgi:hypothetical protein